MPIGMKLPQAPMARLRWRRTVAAAIKRGAVTTQHKNAALSTTRKDNNQVGSGAMAPPNPANAMPPSPTVNTRWAPNLSAMAPPITPNRAPLRLNSEASQPAATSDSPNSACKRIIRGGTLPTWTAATIPAAMATATTPQRLRPGSAAPAWPKLNHLARVHDIVGIEGLFHAPHQIHFDA